MPMNVQYQISGYITSQDVQKSEELLRLHQHILQLLPGCKLWYLDGKDENGKVVSNPNIGYGTQTIHYAKGKTRESHRTGINTNRNPHQHDRQFQSEQCHRQALPAGRWMILCFQA